MIAFGSATVPPLTGLRAALAWLVFPSLLTGVIAGTLALLARPVPPPLISASVLLAVVAVVLALERLAPLHRRWNAFPDRLDLLLVVSNRGIDIAVVAGTVQAIAWLQARGLRPGFTQLWPAEAPLLGQAVLGIALGEVLRYSLHALSHRPGFLWRVHRTHHQPRRMYTLNGPRLHPANQLWIAGANVLPMLLLGASLPAVILTANIIVTFVLFQHANVRLRFDGLNRLLATPDAHRLHHLRQGGARPVNLGIVLLLFDRLFGSYQAPGAEPGEEDIGLAPEPGTARR